MQVVRRPGERPPQRYQNDPPPTPTQYRPLPPSSIPVHSFAALSSSPFQSQTRVQATAPPPPLPAAAKQAPPTAALSLDSIRPLFIDGEYAVALGRYQQLRMLQAGRPNHRSVEWLLDTARVWRMIGECQQKLEAWQDSSASFTNALALVDSALDLAGLTRESRYSVLMCQQQLHHLLSDTDLAMSEAMGDNDDDTARAVELALSAVRYGAAAEAEAQGVLDAVADDEDDMEVKEALMGAKINQARAYTHLMTLTRNSLVAASAVSSTAAKPPSAGHYRRLARHKLLDAYKSADSFKLHQYQYLAHYNLALLHLADGCPLEALRYYQLLLSELFRACRDDGRSRDVEWRDEDWAREELDVQIAEGQLIRQLVEEVELKGAEAVEWLRVGFGWLNAARLTVKSGKNDSGVPVALEVARRNEVAELFNWMKTELTLRQGSGAAAPYDAGRQAVGARAAGARPVLAETHANAVGNAAHAARRQQQHLPPAKRQKPLGG